jgi:hypothetical protein
MGIGLMAKIIYPMDLAPAMKDGAVMIYSDNLC